MELQRIVLIGGLSFRVDGMEISRIFMFNNEQSMTHVTLDDGTVIKIPYHSVLYYI